MSEGNTIIQISTMNRTRLEKFGCKSMKWDEILSHPIDLVESIKHD